MPQFVRGLQDRNVVSHSQLVTPFGSPKSKGKCVRPPGQAANPWKSNPTGPQQRKKNKTFGVTSHKRHVATVAFSTVNLPQKNVVCRGGEGKV